MALSNGIIANFIGQFEERRHDSTMVQQTQVLQNLQRIAWVNGQPQCLYGEPAYPISLHLISHS